MATILKKDSGIVSKLLHLIFNDKTHLNAAFDKGVLLETFSLFRQLLQMYGQLIIFGCAFLYMKLSFGPLLYFFLSKAFLSNNIYCKGWSKSLNSTNYIFN